MTDEELKTLVASLAIAQQKTEIQMARTDKKLDKVAKLLGNMGRNHGEIAEEYFFNSLSHDAHLGAIHFEDITQNMHKQRGKLEEEYDLVMTNGDTIAIVEVKYKAHVNDLNKLERKMRNFKTLFPVYTKYKVCGAIATFHINKDAKDAALERGFFVLQRSGKVIHTDCGPSLLVI